MTTLVNIDRVGNMTQGEQYFTRFIEDVFEDDISARLYFEPKGQATSPDFILYSKRTGIILFEIKDWDISKIVEFKYKEQIVASLNPNEPNRVFNYRSIRELLLKEKKVLEKYLGEKKISVHAVLVFPNIRRIDIENIHSISFEDIKLRDLRDYYTYLFKEDLEFVSDDFDTEKSRKLRIFNSYRHNSSILSEKEEDACLKIIQNLKADNFNFRTTIEDGLQLNLDVGGVGEKEIKTIDKYQEMLVYNYNKPGYRFIKGVAGSGKTVILLSRIKLVAKNFPNAKILLICLSTQLRNFFVKSLKGIENIEIDTFNHYCSRILGYNHDLGTDDELWNNLGKEFIEKINTDERFLEYKQKYDYIFIDEAQDFYPYWGKTIYELAKGNDHYDKNVFAVFDNRQDCLGHKPKSIIEVFNVSGSGRTFSKLNISYRTTKPIYELAQKIFPETGNENIQFYCEDGGKPLIKQVKNDSELSQVINKYIDSLYKDNIMPEDICILVPDWNQEDRRMFGYLKNQIQRIDKENNYKTVKKIKGLEYKAIILINFDYLSDSSTDRSLFYTGITRAQKHVLILYKNVGPLIKEIIN